MWKVAALIEGSWIEIDVVELERQPFSTDALRHVVLERLPDFPRLHDYLGQEIEAGGTRDAIELWSAAAQRGALEFDWAGAGRIEAVEEALAYYSATINTGGEKRRTPSTLAWHDHTAVIIRLSGNEQSIRIEYTPSLREENRVARLRHRYASSEHTLEATLDWRGYFGEKSGIIDHWTTLRRRGDGYVASIKGTAGFIVASVLRRLTRPSPTLNEDPTAKGRLITMSEKYPQIASSCPDLSTVTPVAHVDCAIIFVHGTVSCGIQGLKQLYEAPTQTIPHPIYRYEHDTFRKLDENGSELAELISARVHAKRLLIVAHSRGGLVARTALPVLARGGYRGDISVYTFGTPHEGTPLVALGGKALNLLFKLGEDIIGSIPVMTPLTKAYSYLIDSPTLPPGIEALREDSDALAMLRLHGDISRVRSWGSEFDIQTAPSGFGVLVEGVLLGSFTDRLHDLVVPTPSALAFGKAEPVLTCSHVHYFADPAVKAAISSFCPTPGNPIVDLQPAPSAGGVQDMGDYLIIAGVRVPKKKEASVASGNDAVSDRMAVLRSIKIKKPPPKI